MRNDGSRDDRRPSYTPSRRERPVAPNLIGHVYWAAIHGPIMLQFSGMLPAAFGAERIIGELAGALNARFFGPP